MRSRIHWWIGLCISLACGLASAQEAWPSKPIRIVVGFAAGTPPDIFARLYGDYASKKLGQPVIIDNKPGAAGNLATDTVAKASGDGYTLLYNLSTAFTINPYIYSKLPYDPAKDLTPVATTMRQGLVLIAKPEGGAKTIQELLATAKAKPGTLSHASYGAGSPSHLIVEWFKDETGTQMVHVPYRASPIADIVGGQVDTLMEPIATGFPLISSGKAVALAYSGPTRFAALPNVPTLAEVVPGLSMMSWHGIWAPSATPAAIVNRINAVFVEASRDPELSRRIRELNSEPLGLSRAEMAEAIQRDAGIYSRIVKAKNIRVD
ncbi:tripartite tricarboxylate transporter substrate binding protein [Hylemonella gracilis]|jgi:tripartite-type tricarboxylate transporter receptor subunit TctC|uniref:Tripartite tricarboxylate transporter substrate binding protein n=1 Tax=Hylemonella gracilis TaxID=80880 RepID=A0A4P6ULB4_9BURK|nr:tripartite tricarboxylate transporter substrate binding protein [Hylemonella gracilis]QBK04221.1 tripartite tricarboxylate transporter substrate binding protein [Hylemonella gracilis]